MQIGDLVIDNARSLHGDPPWPADGWLGIILEFDFDGDPLVQWFEKGELLGEALHEFKNTVKLLE